MNKKIEEIMAITGKSLEEVMYLTHFDDDKLDAYYYIVSITL